MARTWRILVSVSKEEKERIKNNADRFNYSQSGYLRALGLQSPINPSDLPDELIQTLSKLLPQIHIEPKRRKGLTKNKISNDV